METGLQKYILLNDRVVEKARFGSKKTIPSQLLRGEILECLPKSKQPKDPEKIALRLFSVNIDENIKLECPKLGVSALTDSEADLLLAVSSLQERLRVYRDERNRLQQSNLDVGYKVFESEGQDTCDGEFRYKRYFDYQADRGVFVAIDALRPRQEQDKPPQKELLPTLKDMMPSFSSKDTSAVRNMAKEHKLKIDQRVVVFPENEDDKVPLRGKVRYISERLDSHGDCPVGIEL
ncbi:uncharacterized protein LOC116286908, partial [Actinia tenebrosa]|uniref:Uncharacterized protein LOC116286908 n=1 Tax=Actinia tenebrosa TaxID=6105 RepID=A0A6P8HA38_ACTTE